MSESLLAPIKGAEHREVGGVAVDVVPVGNCRIKREIYPVGFRWSKNMKPQVGTDFCMHAHVGFLAQGEIHMEFADGCVQEYRAPQVLSIEPGHDGWVVGNEPAVVIEVDFGSDTCEWLGMTPHSH
ncbi:hypothetical protein Acid345_2480 [Candidatus Koribacter versatilis Ellin345]|uniref:Cupin n=1 Tax=Koribacter versatilis (strain Ellin345) TaxID=204669 RepID=Q1INR9_KORVE|nr:hypothetical protein [Candidatus Koribacter versatilis]ABF41481.1 hypothetical protein Acid345_2480 [Candidatus Koribacter versatilis Ellin345]